MAGIKMSERNMSDFEKDVRHALIDKGMSMSDLATELGVTASYVYDIVNGNRVATDMKQKIVDFLRLDGEKYV